MISLECLGVFLSLTSKWLKSDKFKLQRKWGFALTLVVSTFWTVWFFQHDLDWLMFHSIISSCMAIRGIKNNWKDTVRIEKW